MTAGDQTIQMGYIGGLARRLINDGLLTDAAAREAQAKSSKDRIALVHWVVSQNLASALDVGMAASREFGLPLLDLNAMNMEYAPISEVSQALIRDHRALPLFKRGKRLYVATSDPTNLQGLDEIKFNTGLTTEPVLVEDDKLGNFIENALNAMEAASLDVGDEDLENIDLDEGDDAKESEDITRADTESAPVVRFVNKILLDAINRGASDIHFEPYEKKYRVRYRQDGILQEIATPPVQMGMRLAARLKVMSRMDLAERRVPQDGRIKLNLSKTKAIDFRVNTCPTLFGEKIVLRILDPTSAQLGIDALGYEPHQKELYLKFLSKPYGMILVTGPTGSGKTTTLYGALSELNQPQRKIITVEDPVEYRLPRINQVQVNSRIGLNFSNVLRTTLRQDPDIIMVGEMRDQETVEIGLRGALTGHLVLSTLHTNDAVSSAIRLLDMGAAGYLVASSLRGIIAQRLIRRICDNCEVDYQPSNDELFWLGHIDSNLSAVSFKRGKGCQKCNHTGYRGRVGVFELLELTDPMMNALKAGDTVAFGEHALRSPGYKPLSHVALTYAKMGMTTVEEVLKLVEMVAELVHSEEQEEQHAKTDQDNNSNTGGGLSLEDIPDA